MMRSLYISALCLWYMVVIMSMPCQSFQVVMSKEYADNKIVLSEVLFFNQGASLSRDRISLSYKGVVEDSSTNVDYCNDGSLVTICRITNSNRSETALLTIDSHGLFFDTIAIHSPDTNVYGVTVTVTSDSGVSFWQHTITDQKQIHIFDIRDEALAHFPVKIVSTFSYNGEPVALFHVEYLFPVVNEFIIVEARYTISGKKKILYFEKPENRALFAPFMSKIKYLIIDEIPPRPADYIDPQVHNWMDPLSYDAFWGEHYQRQYVKEFIDKEAKTIYLCLDADEIPNRNVVAQFRDEHLYDYTFHRKVRLEMTHFTYNFNWVDPYSWTPPYAVNTAGFLAERDMVVARDINSDRSWYVPSAGWHLSYFFSRADIARKIESFAHVELDDPMYKMDEHIDRCLHEGMDVFMRQYFSRIDVNGSAQQLPEGWREFQDLVLSLQNNDNATSF